MRVAQRASSLRVAGVINFAYRIDIPLTVDADVSEVVAFEARLVVARMVAREQGINRYSMNGSSSVDLVT